MATNNKKVYFRKGNLHCLLVDTETVNDNKIMVDFSGMITNGYMLEQEKFSFLIKEVWENEELMSGIYATNEKKTIWKQQLVNGTRQLVSIWDLIRFVNSKIKQYNIKYFSAYNAWFDKEAYANTLALFGIKVDKIKYLKSLDIWKQIESFVNTDSYIKWCFEKGLFTDNKGLYNISTKVENVYRYLSELYGFTETHIANDDIEIERKTMYACMGKNGYYILGLQKGYSIAKLLQPKTEKLFDRLMKKSIDQLKKSYPSKTIEKLQLYASQKQM